MTGRGTQLIRIAMLSCTVLLMNWQHQRWLSRQRTVERDEQALSQIRRTVPDASGLVRPTDDRAWSDVVDQTGQIIARQARTLPLCSHIIGFSGPTDVLLVAEPQGRLLQVSVLASGDTREHVRKVRDDPDFLPSLKAASAAGNKSLSTVDAVSGATLTSYAILESVRLRLSTASGAEPTATPSLKFPNPPQLTAVRRLFPQAADVRAKSESTSNWQVVDGNGLLIGQVLQTSPAADNIIGYQGPTDTLIGISTSGTVLGIAVDLSYDNEPYVDYVRDDDSFRGLFTGRSTASLAEMNIVDEGIEGVSGATMTSMAVAQGIIVAAQTRIDAEAARSRGSSSAGPLAVTELLLTPRNLSTVGLTSLGAIIGLTHLRRRRRLRVGFQMLVVVWLGLQNGDMVSQALLLGWAQSGVTWQAAAGLTCLTLAAFLIPMATGQNVYCSHICPHGAVQQLLRNRLPWRVRLSRTAQRRLKWIPVALLAWVLLIGVLHLPFSAVDIEPFDAWLITIAGPATLTIALFSLVSAAFVPMAFCRFGCPTGTLLDYVRFTRRGGLERRDAVALGLMTVALLLVITA